MVERAEQLVRLHKRNAAIFQQHVKTRDREIERLKDQLDRNATLYREMTSFMVERTVGETYDVKVVIDKPIWDRLAAETQQAVVEFVAREVAAKVMSGLRSYSRVGTFGTREQR